jgi:hypothetical protein
MFKFGKTLYDMVMEMVAPEDEDEESVNVFDFDEGLNFKLKLVQKGGYNNYDKSKFLSTPKAIADKEQEGVFDTLHDLDEFFAKDRFKSYDELVKKLNGSQAASTVPSIQDELDKNKEAVEAAKNAGAKEALEVVDDGDVDDDDGEDIDFDALLADDDD